MELATNHVTKSRKKTIPARYGVSRAMRAHQDRLACDPDDVEFLHKLIRLRIQQGEVSDAVTLYLQVGRRYLDKGMPVRAVAVVSHVLALDSGHPDALRQLAKAYLALGYLDQFTEVADRLLGRGVVDVELVNAQARIERRRGRLGKALELLKLSVGTDPDLPATLVLLAEVFVQNRKLQSASAVYRHLARLHCRNGDRDAMRGALQNVIEIESRLQPDRDVPIPMSGPGLERAHAALASLPELPPAEDGIDPEEEPVRAGRPVDGQALRRGLAEADFFASRAMLEEALDVLEELAAEHPGHPGIELRLSEILHLDRLPVARTEPTNGPIASYRKFQLCS